MEVNLPYLGGDPKDSKFGAVHDMSSRRDVFQVWGHSLEKTVMEVEV